MKFYGQRIPNMPETMSVYRSEMKFLLGYEDMATLSPKLARFLSPDKNASNSSYVVRSLYFDTPGGRDFREKLDGIEKRQKLRLRTYGYGSDMIRLELKSKIGNTQHKAGVTLKKEDAMLIAQGIYTPLFCYREEAAARLYSMLMLGAYRPAALIEYDRAAYTYPEFNVRLTFDTKIRSCEFVLDLFDEQIPWNPVFQEAVILEVKFDKTLPEFIRKLLAPYSLNAASFSKYCVGRPLMGRFL